MSKWVALLGLGVLLMLSSIAWAQDQNTMEEMEDTSEITTDVSEEEDIQTDDIQSLRQTIDEQQIKLDELIDRLAALEAKQEKGKDETDKAAWAQKIKMKGDFRYRHELIDEQDKKDRNRQRLRTRLTVEAEVNPAVLFNFGLATGENSDPVSTNQSMTGSFTKKPVWIDSMYFKWKPPNATDIQVTAGRIPKPFFIPGNQQLIWDGDLNLEGIGVNYAPTYESNQILFNTGGFWIEERSQDVDSMLYVAQLGLKHTFPGGASNMAIGASLFSYSHAKGFTPFCDATKGFGNTTNTAEDESKTYAYDYKLIEYFLEYNTMMGLTPLQIYGDYVRNIEADNDNTGWMVGFTYGKLKAPKSWAFRYNYRRLEKDAVVGAFSDSDFIGGGTNGSGHVFGFDYQISKNVATSLTYLVNTKGLTNGKNYNRGQLDFNYKF